MAKQHTAQIDDVPMGASPRELALGILCFVGGSVFWLYVLFLFGALLLRL